MDILEKVASSGYEAEQQAGLVQEGGATTDTGAGAGYTGRSLVKGSSWLEQRMRGEEEDDMLVW